MRSGDLYVERGGGDGEGRPVLVLLHGTGGSGAAWRGLVDLLPGHWPGTWVVPDLPGHGGSARLSRYTYGNLAAAVAAVLPGDRPVHLVGHSLGGVVALTPASGWFGVRVASVVGVGIKVRWTAEELAGAAAVAAKPARAFPSRDEAAGRAVKVAGLARPRRAGVPRARPARRQGHGRGLRRGLARRLRPHALAVGAPDMAGLLAVAAMRDVRVVLAAGGRDPMSPEDQLRALVPAPVILPGLGHSAHVEDPRAVLALI